MITSWPNLWWNWAECGNTVYWLNLKAVLLLWSNWCHMKFQ